MKYRATNVTNLIPGQNGFFLNYHGILLQPGKPSMIDLDSLQKMKQNQNVAVDSNLLFDWVRKGWLKLKNPETGESVEDDMNGDPVMDESPTGGRLNEVAASQLPEDDMSDFEDDFDPTFAQEARMPKPGVSPGAHMPPIQNVAGARATISLTGEENRETAPDGFSPIPGSRPVHVDNSEAFTIRAPRSNGPGGVIKG